ncbi:phosphocholine cytidylyltransferase family protein [Azospirillum rugosum]|uniref:Choline kinase n=1 Tax=Azospirillum rugosum TaxID=416170 RepID=A0ABS4STA7_9PROT|nr:phosphocholine cytidylyltransferase family protein [Azospirillum rugosum]MBP2295775.1 choline kinase [Azospirillum rugosum]MDQ0529114.1 choline kinase [Azospirillum rugosum]
MTAISKDDSPARLGAGAGQTRAIILAAGRGTRLKENTDDRPKCLVAVAGRPILSRMLDELGGQGITDIVIAVGYRADDIRRHVAEHHPAASVRFVENERYLQTGSVCSLALALDDDATDRHLLIVEGDVVLEPGLCGPVLRHIDTAFDAATLLAPYEPALSGTFALVEDGRVVAWTHESRRGPGFPLTQSYKTVNITLVKQGLPARRLRDAVLATIAACGATAPLEYAMQALVVDGLRIAAVPVDGARWYEVDTPDELAIANGLFAATR